MGRYKSSAAVMARRTNDFYKNLDYYPTPYNATHALMRWLFEHKWANGTETAYEPAAGGGHMARILNEYFETVITSDIVEYDYPLNFVGDFTADRANRPEADWLITNPPFKLFDKFATIALNKYNSVALLARVQALEGMKRYDMLWKNHSPSAILVFKGRVKMTLGRLPNDSDPSSAVAFAWFVFRNNQEHKNTIVDWL